MVDSTETIELEPPDVVSRSSLAPAGVSRRRPGEDVSVVTTTVDGEERRLSVVRPRLRGDLREATARYIDGVRGWAAVDSHDGVRTVVDWGVTADGPWVATEHRTGETLGDRLADGPLPPETALDVTVRCASALLHAHESRERVFHHALTPQHVHLDGTRPVVDGLGTAAALLTGAGGVSALSPAYAAPEQFAPDEFGDPGERTDVYRLGAVLCAALTGGPPHGGAEGATLVECVTDPETVPTRPGTHSGEVPGDVDTALDRALATDPCDRYATVAAFTRALGEVDGIETTGTVAGTTAWRQVGGHPATTRSSPGLGPSQPDERVWALGTGHHHVESAPVVVDGTVFVGGDDNAVHAVDAETGVNSWVTELSGTITAAPAVAGDTVVVPAGETLYGFDRETGETEWTVSTARIRTATTVTGGTAVFGDNDGTVRAVAADTGESRWETTVGGSLSATPAVVTADSAGHAPDVDTVYVGSVDTAGGDGSGLYALSARTGDVRWHADTGPGPESIDVDPAVRYGSVYAATRGGEVHAVDAETGSQQWAHDAEAYNLRAPAVAEGRVYVTGDAQGLTALDAETGDVLWRVLADETTTPPAVTDGVVVVGTASGRLLGIDARDGSETWSLDLGQGVRTAPGLGESVIAVGGADGDVLAVGEATDSGDTGNVFDEI